MVLVQLCAPRNAIMYFQSLKYKREKLKHEYMQNQMPSHTKIYSSEADVAQSQIKKQMRPEDRLKLKNFLCSKNKHAA